MSISIMQAVILALWYWVTTWYIGYTWGSATFGDALVTGLVVGIVMGDVPTAMKCAAAIRYHRCSVEPLVCSVAYHPPYRIHLSGSKS